MTNQNLPALPYPDAKVGATSGHSGSDTSRKLAEHADASGETKGQQKIALRLLEQLGAHGLTWTELLSELWVSGYPKAHHGAASRTLSNLHRAGLVARLAASRNERKIYVLPQYIDDRETELPRDQRGPKTTGVVVLTDDEQAACDRLVDETRRMTNSYYVIVPRRHCLSLLELLSRLGVKGVTP